VLLDFNEADLTIRYYDEHGEELHVEKMHERRTGGDAQGSILKASSDLHWFRAPEQLLRQRLRVEA